jgi:hypothetical protein
MEVMTVYKVTIPNWCIWPGIITLKVCMTREAAQQYIDEYPNPFLRAYLTIEEEQTAVPYETD